MGLGVCAIFLLCFGIVFQSVLPRAIIVILFGIGCYLCIKGFIEFENEADRNSETAQNWDSERF